MDDSVEEVVPALNPTHLSVLVLGTVLVLAEDMVAAVTNGPAAGIATTSAAWLLRSPHRSSPLITAGARSSDTSGSTFRSMYNHDLSIKEKVSQ